MRKLGTVAIVLAGLLSWLLAIQLSINLGYAVQMVSEGGGLPSIGFAVLNLLPAAVAAIVASGLIYSRHDLAERWFEDGPLDGSIDPVPLLRLGLILVGVSALISAIGSIVASGSSLVFQPAYFDDTYTQVDALRQLTPGILSGVVRLGLGLWLVLRSAELAARLWLGSEPEVVKTSLALECPSCGQPYDPQEYESTAPDPRCTACGEKLVIPRA